MSGKHAKSSGEDMEDVTTDEEQLKQTKAKLEARQSAAREALYS